MIVCAAIVGKANDPLYLRNFDGEGVLRYHFIVHTSLDVIEDNASVGNRGSFDMYLGHLYSIEDCRVYGYLTNTYNKFIVIVKYDEGIPKDADIKTFFRKLHSAFVDMSCNPFYSPGDAITSNSFDETVSTLITLF